MSSHKLRRHARSGTARLASQSVVSPHLAWLSAIATRNAFANLVHATVFRAAQLSRASHLPVSSAQFVTTSSSCASNGPPCYGATPSPSWWLLRRPLSTASTSTRSTRGSLELHRKTFVSSSRSAASTPWDKSGNRSAVSHGPPPVTHQDSSRSRRSCKTSSAARSTRVTARQARSSGLPSRTRNPLIGHRQFSRGVASAFAAPQHCLAPSLADRRRPYAESTSRCRLVAKSPPSRSITAMAPP